MNDWIKLSLPHKSGNEMKWVEEAYRDDWFVPLGPNVNEFEHRLESFTKSDKHVVALSAGTAALHLGLVMLGVEKGDEVICQDLTFSASANPICYQGATPVFVDSEDITFNMSPETLVQAIEARIKATGKKPKAIVVVDLYGMPAQWDKIIEIANHYEIPILEDSAEAMGSEYKGAMCGTFGEYGVMSFNGNKMITTSGGGALICPTEESAKRVKFLATQAREDRPYYYHEVVGYNYRLSNISAGIGCGQLEDIDKRLQRRRDIHALYKNGLADLACVSVQDNPSTDYDSNFWLSTIQIANDAPLTPDETRIQLLEKKIETRLLWRPMHMQPVFKSAPYYGGNIGETLFNNGLCLPSGSSLTNAQIECVIDNLHKLLK